MKLRRCLLASAAPVALAVGCAGPALAAVPPVSVRVEGPTRTLLETKTVTAPSTGSITLGGTPKGQCPADSAAGALRACWSLGLAFIRPGAAGIVLVTGEGPIYRQ